MKQKQCIQYIWQLNDLHMKKFLPPIVLLFSFYGFSQITVDETLTAQQLVEDILVNSTCAEVSNFIQQTGTDFGDDNGIAFFDGNGSDFPFASGVVLTSGNVANAPGPNTNLLSDGGFGWPGDADLEANTTATNTNNASFLQFDFVPQIPVISFDFIMASEEYNQNFECVFSDAFAFILTDQVTGVVQNLAVLPGTAIPIEVTNIRPEVVGGCAAVNEEFFDKYNFEPFNIAANAAINFNGQTVQLTAMGPVTPGNPYTIKLVVADETDTAFDIAVFLEEGSFNIGDVDLGLDLTVINGTARCQGTPFIITPDVTAPPGTTYQWAFENPIGSGFTDIPPPEGTQLNLEVSDVGIGGLGTGNYRLTVSFGGGAACDTSGEIFIEFVAPPVVNLTPDPLIECENDNNGFTEFTLSDADASITLGDPDLFVTYHGTPLDAINDANELPDPYINDDIYNDTVYARVASMTSSCIAVVELDLEVRFMPVITTPAEPLRACDNDDGVINDAHPFDLTLVEMEVLTGLDPTMYDVYYYEDEADAITAGDLALTAPDFSGALTLPYTNITNPQVIFILVVGNDLSVTPPNPNGASGCYDIVPLTLIVDPVPVDLGPFEAFLCDDDLNGSTLTDEISTFDLTLNDAAVIGADPTLVVTWYETVADEAMDNPIADPTMFQNTITPQTVIARVTTEFGCNITSTLTLTVLPNPTPNTTPIPLELCDDNDDGLISGFGLGFDLTLADADIIGAEADVSVLYYFDLADAQAGIAGTELVSPYGNVVPNLQTVYARVTRDVPPGILPCFTIVPLDLIVIALPDMPAVGFLDPMEVCDDNGDGEAIFDLTLNDPFVLGIQDPADFVLPITYYTDVADANAGVNAILPADVVAFPSAGQTIWVRLESSVTGCARVSSFELVVGTFPTIGVGDDLFLCDDEINDSTPTDGLSTFNLTLNTDLIDLGDGTLDVQYFGSLPDQMAGIVIATPEAYQNIIAVQQEIFVSVFNGEGCSALTSFFINVEPNPNAITPTPLRVCDEDNDGFFTEFDLTQKDIEIANGETDVTVAYYGTINDAVLGNPGDVLPNPYSNVVPFNETVYARVTRDVPPGVLPCFTIVELELIIDQLPAVPANGFIDPMELCDDDGDGEAIFDLTLNDPFVLGTQDPADFVDPITYYTDVADADAGINAILAVDAMAFPSTGQTIWVRLENINTGCARVSSFELVVAPLPVLGAGPFDQVLCDDEVGGSTSTDGISTFNLSLNDPDITLGDGSLSVFYYETMDDQNNNVPIADPTAYQNVLDNPQDIFVTVFSMAGCEARTNLTLRVLPNPTPSTPTALEVCDDDRDGFAEFDLTSKDAEILNSEPDVSVLYYIDFATAEAGVVDTELLSPYTNEVANNQIVYARVTRDVPPGELPCFTIVELELIVNPLPDDSVDISDVIDCQVPFVGTSSIMLNTKDDEILNGQDGSIFTVFYYETQADADAMTNAIASDTFYPYDTTEITLYVGILNTVTGCYITNIDGTNDLSFTLVVKQGATATSPAEPYTVCDTAPNDGMAEFDLSDPMLIGEILNGQDPSIYDLTFHQTPEEADAGTGALPTIYTNVINPQVIYVRVTNGDNTAPQCYDVAEVILNVDQAPEIVLDDQYRLCVDEFGTPIAEEFGGMSPPLIDTGLDPSVYVFTWSLDGVVLAGEFGPSITAVAGGLYEVTATELLSGCSTTAQTTVTVSSAPITFDAQVVTGAFASSHAIEATATGLGVYQFQLDTGPFQSSGLFEDVFPGTHTITIQDVNGCGSVIIEIGVIDYPRFVTPNQDGYHDTWNIIGIADSDPSAKIYIFDRNGKLLKQVSPLGPGWDGTYNGNPLPSSDYWFLVEYEEDQSIKEFRGHFTLKR